MLFKKIFNHLAPLFKAICTHFTHLKTKYFEYFCILKYNFKKELVDMFGQHCQPTTGTVKYNKQSVNDSQKRLRGHSRSCQACSQAKACRNMRETNIEPCPLLNSCILKIMFCSMMNFFCLSSLFYLSLVFWVLITFFENWVK